MGRGCFGNRRSIRVHHAWLEDPTDAERHMNIIRLPVFAVAG
jgi:hypothetical protein